MNNSLFLKVVKYKKFKTIILLLALVTTSILTLVGTSNTITNHHGNLTSNITISPNKLSGLHITVSKNNQNLVDQEKRWNSINDQYEDYISNHPEEMIVASFDQWSDVFKWSDVLSETSKDKTIWANDKVSGSVNKSFHNQLNKILPGIKNHYFNNNIAGRSIAKKSFKSFNSSNIKKNSIKDSKSFGYVYVNYRDVLPAKIKNGLFATITPESTFNNYFPIPYTIAPSDTFLKTHLELKDRIKTFQLGNDPYNTQNQPTLVILAKKDKNEQLIVKNNNTIDTFNSDTISYAVLNHDPHDNFKTTNFKISVQGTTENYDQNISLTNNCSPIIFTNSKELEATSKAINTKYLIKTDNSNSSLIVMNSAFDNAIFNVYDRNQKWKYWKVDANTLKKSGEDNSIVNGVAIAVDEQSDFQVYCFAMDSDDKAIQAASEQYLVISKPSVTIPPFNQCTDFFSKENKTRLGFQQYLSSSSNITIDNLKDYAGELLSWFIQYQSDNVNHQYVNYLVNGKLPNPWNIYPQLITKTLVSNWNIIIISTLVFSLLITIPMVVVIIRKKKHLK